MDEKLIEYIKTELKQGVSKENIKSTLTSVGWQEEIIEKAFNQVGGSEETLQVDTSINEITSEKIKGPIRLLKDSVNLFKSNFKKIYLVSLLPILVLILSGFLTGMLKIYLTAAFSDGNSELVSLLLSVFLVLPIIVFVVFFQFWSQAALLYVIDEGDLTVINAFKKGIKKALPYFWVALLSMFFAISGIFLFIVPGIIFLVWFALSSYIVIFEKERGIKALLKSREYVRGRWFGVLTRILFMVLIVLVFAIPQVAFEYFELTYAKLIFDVLLSPLMGSIAAIYFYSLYKNLVDLKGKFDFVPSKKTKVALIVVATLSLLVIPAAIFILLFFSLNPGKRMAQARDMQRLSDTTQIRQALEIYYIDNGFYPSTLDQLVPDYITQIQKDPETDLEYQYFALPGGKNYQLCVNYEEKAYECVGSTINEYYPSPVNDI